MPYYPGNANGAADGVNIVSAGTQIAGTNATVVFSNANNVSFGMNNSSVVTASASVAAGAGDGVNILAAGTQTANTTGTVSFADSNGITFGLSNSSIMTATVRTDYQSSGNYLTTARASNDAVGLNTAKTNATWTVNSSGISLDAGAYLTTAQPVGAYLTTAMQSNAVTLSNIKVSGGASSLNLSALTFADSNGISFGLSNNSVMTATVKTDYQSSNANYLTSQSNQAASAANGSFAFQTVSFSNLNGISFGTSAGSAITASHNALTTARASNDAIGLNTAKTNVTWTVNSSGLSLDAGAYLTTAMASNRGTDFVQANAAFAGTNASGTIASNGISVSVAAPGGGGGPTLKGSGTYTQSTGTVEFANSNGITFGLSNNGTMTASHNAITTARASNDAIGLNTAQSNVTWTVNSSGLSLDARGYAGTNTATTGNISVTLNSSGLSLNAPSFLTTAAQSSASNISGVVAATASNAATNQTAQLSGAISFSNTNGVSFYTTASGAVSGIGATVATNYQSQGAYLTTARASNDAVGLNTAKTNATWTVNSSGISLDAGAYLTTAMASNAATISNIKVSGGASSLNLSALTFADSNGISFGLSNNSVMTATVATTYAASNHSHGNPTLALTNLSGTTASASNGLTLSLSAAAAGGVNPAASASNGSFAFTTLNFSNANNVTFGSSAGGIITASVAAPGAAAENNWVNLLGANTAGNTTASGSTIGMSGINLTLSGTNGSAINISAPATSSLSGTGQVSLSTNGSTISIGVPNPVTVSRYNEFKESPLVAGNIGQASLHMQPWLIPNLQFDRVVVHKAFSNATNSSFSFTVSDWVGIYTRNVSTLSLLHSTSNTTNFSGSGTAGSYLSYGGGIKAITMGLTQTLTEGMYWIGVINRTTTGGGAGHTLDQALNSNLNSSYRGLMGVATNATNQMSLGFGVYTVSTAGMPNSVAFTEINGNSSVFQRPPSLYFVSGTI